MELIEYADVLFRRIWIVVILTILVPSVVLIALSRNQPNYNAEAIIHLSPPAIIVSDYGQYLYFDRLIYTVEEIANSNYMQNKVREKLGSETVPQITANVVPGTELLTVSSSASDADLAVTAANALAESLIDYYRTSGIDQDVVEAEIQQLQGDISRLQEELRQKQTDAPQDTETIQQLGYEIADRQAVLSTFTEDYATAGNASVLRANTISLLQPAELLPLEGVLRSKLLPVLLSGMVGALLGITVSLVVGILDTRIHRLVAVRDLFDYPIFASIPLSRRLARTKRNCFIEIGKDTQQAKAFRRLRTTILSFNNDSAHRTILVTSAEAAEGKSMIVASLAQSLATLNFNVAVVDANLRCPSQHQFLDGKMTPGLADVLKGKSDLHHVLQRLTKNTLLLSAGQGVANPTELLTSPPMQMILRELQTLVDYVLIDTPSLDTGDDAVVILRPDMALLMVVGLSVIHRDTLQAATERLRLLNLSPCGVVVNRTKSEHV